MINFDRWKEDSIKLAKAKINETNVMEATMEIYNSPKDYDRCRWCTKKGTECSHNHDNGMRSLGEEIRCILNIHDYLLQEGRG